VKVLAGDLVQYDHVRAGGSFLSGNDPRLHFGLGEHKIIDGIEIRWPAGGIERLSGVKANQIIALREGAGMVPYPSKGAAARTSR
jgi:hypothetical protein